MGDDPRFRFDNGMVNVLASSLASERVARCFGCARFQQWDEDLACVHSEGLRCARGEVEGFVPWSLRIVGVRRDGDSVCIGIEGASFVPVQAYRFQAVELLGSRDTDLFADSQVEGALQGLVDVGERAPDGEARTLYYGEWDGFVRICVHDPKNQRGYGGREFRFHMRDGTQRLVKGPWSGGSGLLVRYGLGSVHDVPVVHAEGTGICTITDVLFQELRASAPFGEIPGRSS